MRQSIRQTLCALLASSAALSVSPAHGVPTLYDISFAVVSGSPAPTAGRFLYDPVLEVFSGFTVDWHGVVFDLTPAANSASALGVCDTLGNAAADAFHMLSTGCGGGTRGWSALGAGGTSTVIIRTNYNHGALEISGTLSGLPVGPSTSADGTFEISAAAVPEPTSLAIMAVGLFGLGVCTRRFRKFPPAAPVQTGEV